MTIIELFIFALLIVCVGVGIVIGATHGFMFGILGAAIGVGVWFGVLRLLAMMLERWIGDDLNRQKRYIKKRKQELIDRSNRDSD